MRKFERYSLFYLNCFFFLISGFCGNTGSSIPEFGKIYNVSLVELSSGMVIRAFGSCLGSLIAGYTLEKWNRQLQFASSIFLNGLFTVFLPICLNIRNYFILLIFESFLMPFIIIVPGVWIAELFSGNSSFYLLIVNFFFSFGEILTPLFLGFFLNDKITNQVKQISFNQTLTNDKTVESNLWIPYLAFGCLNIFCSLLFFIAYCIKPYKKSVDVLTEVNNNLNEEKISDEDDTSSRKNIVVAEGEKDKNISTKYLVFFTIMTCFLIALQIGNELNCMSFLPSYLIKSPLGLNAKQAAYITTILSFTKAIGRLITSFIIIKVNIEAMVFFNLIVVFSGNLLLVTLGIQSITMTWISLALIGSGLSSTFPLIQCFVEKNISLRAKYSSIFNVAISLLLSVTSLLVGHLIETAPNDFIYYNMFTIVLMFIIFIILVISTKFQKRSQNQESLES